MHALFRAVLHFLLGDCPLVTRQTALAITVYEAALDRVRRVYDECDEVIVAMSGGKDSTVLLHLARVVAAERGALPVKIYWLDQEAEWQATEDYMRAVMHAPDVKPFWFQFPFRLWNSLSAKAEFLHCWNPADREIWLREQDPLSIKVNPLIPEDRFHYLVKNLPACCEVAQRQHVGVLIGVRMVESLMRRYMLWRGGETYKGIKWCHRGLIRNTRSFWPIYDFTDQDVWACIAKNALPYNRIYDAFYRFGISGKMMRVSALIHETSWYAMRMLQEVEPRTYDRVLKRVPGASTFGQLIDDIIPHSPPPYFRDWLEYRDYLLQHLIEPQHQAIFRDRWKDQHDETWLRSHVAEIVVNDLDGTKNGNTRGKIRMLKHKQAQLA